MLGMKCNNSFEVFSFSYNKLFQKTNQHIHSKIRRNIFTSVRIGIETCLAHVLIMLLKHGDLFHIFIKG
jgi:hypothetical protein